MVEPPATMGWVSAPLLDFPFTALESSSLKQVGQTCHESDCTAIVVGSHVKLVMILIVELANTTPQMTCFRGPKVCTKWLQGKSDDELIKHDNKMKIWTRSGKFRKVEKTRIVHGLVTKQDTDVNDNIDDCVALHDAYTTDNFH